MKFHRISLFHTGLILVTVFSSTCSVPIALIPSRVSPTEGHGHQEASFLFNESTGGPKVRLNLIQSSEENSIGDKSYQRFDKVQSSVRQGPSVGGTKSHLAKFYRSGHLPVRGHQPDAIVFPSTSSDVPSPFTEDVVTAAELPEKDFITLYGETVRTLRSEPQPDHHHQRDYPTHPVQTSSPHETEEPSYEELFRLLTSLLSKLSEPSLIGVKRQTLHSSEPFRDIPLSHDTRPDVESSEETKESQEATTPSPQSSQEVGTYSLYSGPKIKDAPCPPGQQRTHAGHCQGKSRRLASSNG